MKKLKQIGAILALALVVCMAVAPQAKAGGAGWIDVQDNYYAGHGSGRHWVASVTYSYYGPLPGFGGLDHDFDADGPALYSAYASASNNANASMQAAGGMCPVGNLMLPCRMLF